MRDYGVRLYRQGIDFKLDKRQRDLNGEAFVIPVRASPFRTRRAISGLSKSSARRLEFIAANVAVTLTTLLTLTYRENPVEGESEEMRNLRVARRSKADLNRFLTCVRLEIGHYLWVQEFQERGVVHYHVLCEKPISEQRVRLTWCRAIGALHDEASLRYGVKVEAVANAQGARSYVGRYFGKQRQKSLPEGVVNAGRWWGRSRGLELELVEEVVTCQAKAQDKNGIEVWVARQLRRYLTRKFGWKFRGGFLVDWGGRLCDSLTMMTRELRQYFMDEVDRETGRAVRLAEGHGWDVVPEFRYDDERESSGARVENALAVLGLDEQRLGELRRKWDERIRRLPRKRRGLYADYFPSLEGLGEGRTDGESAANGGDSVEPAQSELGL